MQEELMRALSVLYQSAKLAHMPAIGHEDVVKATNMLEQFITDHFKPTEKNVKGK